MALAGQLRKQRRRGRRAGRALGWFLLALATVSAAHAESDRLLATGGVTELEGSGGGGLVPWALITGLGTNDQVGASAACTYVKPQHFALTSCGAAVGIRNRVELSYAHQTFNLDDVARYQTIEQHVFGAKVRLWGDAVIDQDRWWPQVAAGLQYKKNEDFNSIPSLIGARGSAGTDFYLSATKVYLSGPLSLSWLVDATLRATRANQFGILGFGGDRGNGYSYRPEASLAVFLTDSLVLGGEYRDKPNNLSAFREQAADDAFLAWFPWKYVSLTTAYVDLGDIATHPGQHAWYVSVQGNY
jgi:hypothetical protein